MPCHAMPFLYYSAADRVSPQIANKQGPDVVVSKTEPQNARESSPEIFGFVPHVPRPDRLLACSLDDSVTKEKEGEVCVYVAVCRGGG